MDFFNSDQKSAVRANGKSVAPLADKMRPRSIDEVFGQDKIVGEGSPLRKQIESDQVKSMIFWGPPGSGKTTIAEVIAEFTKGQFVRFSAVSASIKEVKALISKAGSYFQLSGRRTYIFVDEIHRFNKAQQDAFLPYVEKGDIVLIGATTENPSFEVNSALLSRLRVFVLDRLSEEALKEIVLKAISSSERGLGDKKLAIDDEAVSFIAASGDGDARRALTLLETTADFVGENGKITVEELKKVHQRNFAVYDKSAEEHYNIISALHKAMRGGDPDASLYWLARMLDGGEDPMYIIRRLVRFASEDIGIADPSALTITLNAKESFHFLGSPEGELAIAQAVIYMACAPKSNSSYTAYKKAKQDATEKGSLPVPLWIRNAPTSLMKDLGYGKGYKYSHDFENGITDQEYFPEKLSGSVYYEPKNAGRESKLIDYLQKYREYRKKT